MLLKGHTIACKKNMYFMPPYKLLYITCFWLIVQCNPAGAQQIGLFSGSLEKLLYFIIILYIIFKLHYNIKGGFWVSKNFLNRVRLNVIVVVAVVINLFLSFFFLNLSLHTLFLHVCFSARPCINGLSGVLGIAFGGFLIGVLLVGALWFIKIKTGKLMSEDRMFGLQNRSELTYVWIWNCPILLNSGYPTGLEMNSTVVNIPGKDSYFLIILFYF